MNCPLCRSSDLETAGTLSLELLARMYKKMLDMDVSRLFLGKDLAYMRCGQCDLRFFSPMVTGDEAFYNALQKLPWYYQDEKAEYAMAREFITPADKLLEVGCGKGAFADMLPGSDYMGLDLSPRAKELALEKGVRVECETIETHAVKFPATYDIVCSFQVLEHVTDAYSFLKASVDCLKSGGRLIIAVPSEDSYVRGLVNAVLNMPPHHNLRWSDACLRSIADLFSLRTEALVHERVQQYHVPGYLSALATCLVNKTIGRRQPMLDESLAYRLVNRVASKFSRMFKESYPVEMLPHGHTVLTVFSKH
ncbi:MAG: type 12 [Desulfovibrionaceae bacterium]|nr:MAG: type 12 [Desulfovibrionaceae bacterium]